ncbi:MAG: 3-oxoacyl-[acyl-carrier-protein] reductase [Anaeroplasmataceae bacterium]
MIAIVTGSTRGIGKDIAISLAKNGYNVVINYNSNEQKAIEVKKLCDEYNESIIVKGNVAKMEDASNIVDEAIKKFGRIDLLVNNAGITKDNLLLRMTESDFDDVIDTNLKGVFNMSKLVSKIMLKQKSGNIINISSVIGVIGNAGQTNYAASKAGIIGFSKSLAKELASRGIRVNCVAPGFIETDMTAVLTEEQQQNILKNIPLNRLGKPSDISNLVLFLASDNASYITGQVINVCGGMVI